MNLQKELEDQKEDYTDQLIDQKITALQQQNDEAASQRERQIELAQAQLDYSIENGEINKNVQKIIKEGIGLDGKIIEGSPLYNLIESSADYSGLTAEQQKKYWDDLQASITDYLSYVGVYKSVGGDESEYKIGDDISSALGGLPAGAKATVTREGAVEIDMEEELAQLGEEAINNGNNPVVKRYSSMLDKIDSKISNLQSKIQPERKRVFHSYESYMKEKPVEGEDYHYE